MVQAGCELTWLDSKPPFLAIASELNTPRNPNHSASYVEHQTLYVTEFLPEKGPKITWNEKESHWEKKQTNKKQS